MQELINRLSQGAGAIVAKDAADRAVKVDALLTEAAQAITKYKAALAEAIIQPPGIAPKSAVGLVAAADITSAENRKKISESNFQPNWGQVLS